MAELLVYTNSRNEPFDRARYQRGDVVFVAPDGHTWGKEEIHGNLFRIIKLPNVPFGTAIKALAHSTGIVASKSNILFQKCCFSVDLDALESPAESNKAHLEVSDSVDIAYNETEFFQKFVTQKPPIYDDTILGEDVWQ